jgi:hypothetical protein
MERHGEIDERFFDEYVAFGIRELEDELAEEAALEQLARKGAA